MAVIQKNTALVIDYTDEGWDEFKKWLNGTYASLPYAWVDEGLTYQIVAADGSLCRLLNINKSDATEFESTYKLNIPLWKFATETTLSGLNAKISTDSQLGRVKITDGSEIADITLISGVNYFNTTGPVTNSTGSKIVTVIDDVDTPENKRLMVESAFKPGQVLQTTSGASASTGTISERLQNGGSEDMVVNGSVTPQVFSFSADATEHIQLTSLRLVFSAAFFNFDGNTFGKGGGAITNGVSVDIVANGGTFTTQLAELFVNEDFLRLLDFSVSQAGATDVMAASLPFGGKTLLEAGSADTVTVTINDDLSGGSRGITYFTATIYGIQGVENGN